MALTLMKGSEAIAEAAIRAGARFFFGYPITPQNQIPEYMSKRMPKVGGAGREADKVYISRDMDRALTRADEIAGEIKDEFLSVEHLFLGLIDAETAESARNAAAQLSGALRRPIESVYDKLLDVSSRFYAVVDYPDEDIEDLSREETERTLLCCEETLSDLLGTFARGKVLKNGVATAIIGAPNAGKSSLLNALVGFDRAIVTDIAGTTRDTVEEKATVGGVLLRLIDTAGLHETDDLVEQLGVERSKKAVEDADLILALLDGSTGLPASEARAAEMLAPLELAAKSGKPWLLLLTKSALGGGAGIVPDKDWRTPEAIISLSSVTHEGFEALEAAIRTLYPAPKGDTSLVTNARQADAIRRALDSVRAAKDALQSGMTPDVVLTEVEQAENALGELTGRTAREDMVARIFERFCVGK